MKFASFAACCGGALAIAGAPAARAETDLHQWLIQKVMAWYNQAGASLLHGESPGFQWADQTANSFYVPQSFDWAVSAVSYGQPSGQGPAVPVGLETMMGVNCPGQDQPPSVVKLNFQKSTAKGATFTVTQGVSASVSLTVSAGGPDLGAGVSSTAKFTVSSTTASSQSTQVSYSYGVENDVTVEPGKKVYATLYVTFQDIVVPWAANVQFVGSNLLQTVQSWISPASMERIPTYTVVEEHFSSLPGTIASGVPGATTPVPIQGNFTGVYASVVNVVDGPEEPLTPAEIRQNCNGPPGRPMVRAIEVPLVQTLRR